MVNLYSNPTLKTSDSPETKGYTQYVEPDTSIPPKAKNILNIVSVNGVEIAERNILAEAQHHPSANPGEAIHQATQALVIRELLLQRAKQLGICCAPQNEGKGKWETEEDGMIRQLLECEIDVPSSTEEECRRYYGNNLQRFSSETIYEASHILCAVPLNNSQLRKSQFVKATEICEELKQNLELFGSFAREFSACPSREQGGNLGQLTQGSTVEEFDNALSEMEGPGFVPNPVESRFGYHLIRVDCIIPGEVFPFDHVREKISLWLEASSWSKAVSQYIHVLSSEAEIAGFELSDTNGPLVQ